MKVPADFLHQNLSDCLGGKEVMYLTGTILKYTRNNIRYISNAGGWDGMFFLCLHTDILKSTIVFEPAFQADWYRAGQRIRH
jgi:hypothetical protein